MNNTIWKLTINLIAFVCVTACVNPKSATYFSDQKDAEIKTSNQSAKALIRNNDVLNINVTSMSTQPTNLFNISNVSSNSNPSSSFPGLYNSQPAGYLVDPEGYIKLPYLGKIKAEGLSSNELADTITNGILSKKLMIDPIVNVRLLNFKVTVLGEVGRPMVINVPNEKISILEAIGMAGDLTMFAKRDRVLLIREEDGKKVTKRLDLNSSSMLTSPYYYLKSNDVIYVEPNNAKISSTSKSRQVLPIIFSAMCFAVIILDRIAFRN
jgi:polysaccharide biosynthesis/export protein